jgi:hypothetical protein
MAKKWQVGRPEYEDFGLRADDLIGKCMAVPPGTPVVVMLDDKGYWIEDVDKEWDYPRPEWRQMPADVQVPVLLYLYATNKELGGD